MFHDSRLDPEAVWSFGHWVAGGEVRMDLMVEDPPSNLSTGASAMAKPVMWWVTLPVVARQRDGTTLR